MTRTSTTLIGAGIGMVGALIAASIVTYNSALSGAYLSPDWIAHGVGYVAHWVLIGGLIGSFYGKKKQQP
jgi:hypothetical protein